MTLDAGSPTFPNTVDAPRPPRPTKAQGRTAGRWEAARRRPQDPESAPAANGRAPSGMREEAPRPGASFSAPPNGCGTPPRTPGNRRSSSSPAWRPTACTTTQAPAAGDHPPASAGSRAGECMIVCNDATVERGGTYYPMTVKKHVRAQEDRPGENHCRASYLVRLRRSLPPTVGTTSSPDRGPPSAASSTTRPPCRGSASPRSPAVMGMCNRRRRLHAGQCPTKDRHRSRKQGHDLPRRPAAGERRPSAST